MKNNLKINQQILSKSPSKRPGGNHTKTSITIHSTANEQSTAKNERNWLTNPNNNRSASWHYCVDENDIIQAIPDNETAYHCGNSYGNTFSLSIEICESGNRLKALENAVELTAQKMIELNLTLNDIKTHFDWTGKNCPRILIDRHYIKDNLNWDWFIRAVKQRVGELTAMNNEEFKALAKDCLEERAKLPVSEWAEEEWQRATKLGITDGSKPQSYATREQVIAMIMRALEV